MANQSFKIKTEIRGATYSQKPPNVWTLIVATVSLSILHYVKPTSKNIFSNIFFASFFKLFYFSVEKPEFLFVKERDREKKKCKNVFMMPPILVHLKYLTQTSVNLSNGLLQSVSLVHFNFFFVELKLQAHIFGVFFFRKNHMANICNIQY